MAGIRGIRNPFPSKGKAPTGIFSTRGKQKQDGASGPRMDTLAHAHSSSNDKNGTSVESGPGNRGKRHQAPRTKSATSAGSAVSS
jgi:hypothetical protein